VVVVSSALLVIDVGTSEVRSAVVHPDASLAGVHHRRVLPSSPAPGLVELDPIAIADAAMEVAAAALTSAGPVGGIGIANQRASAIAWDRKTGEPVGPGIGWQDLRTVGTCLALKEQGISVAPNQSATKFAHLLDEADPQRKRDLCLGTVDTWIAWRLSGGSVHVTDASNAAVTGLLRQPAAGAPARDWDAAVLEALHIPPAALPDVVDSSGSFGTAPALGNAVPMAALIGDQQASLVGQGCVHPGMTKITFGTGAMLDMTTGEQRPGFERQGDAGCFPIVAWQQHAMITWGVEAIALAAGTNVEWLRDDLGVIDTAEQSHDVAAACDDTGGVVFVPALLGFGTPRWDYGARGALLGVTRGTERPHLVRAVLEGVAHTGVDLVEAAEQDTGRPVGTLRIDGGMSDNPTFVQALADAAQRPVEVSPEREATTLGAGFLAGLAMGTWSGWDEIAATWQPRRVVDPARAADAASADRERWRTACDRAAEWHPELSAISF
jgi:glycerol kinase